MTAKQQQCAFYRELIRYDIDKITDPDMLHYLWLVTDNLYEEGKKNRKSA